MKTQAELLKIINQYREDVILERHAEITRSKQLELLKLHNILMYKRLKFSISEIGLRTRIFKVYLVLIKESNIEKYYNIPIKKFIIMLWNGEIN